MPKTGGLYYAVRSLQPDGLPVLMLIHGAGGSAAQWPYQLRRLPGWRVLAPDLPGHGHSDLPAQSSLEKYAASLWAWADEMGIEQATLCGHSMGAAIALHMALAAPQRALGLALLGAAARFAVNPRLLEKLSSPPREQDSVRNIVQWSFGRAAHAALRRAYTRQLQANPPGLLYEDYKACARFDLRSSLGQVKAPALVLCGAEDQMVSPHLSAALAEGLPRASLQTIPSAGHMLMLEQPGAVGVAIEKSLEAWKPS